MAPPPGDFPRQTVTPNLLPRVFQILTGIFLGLAVVLWILKPEGEGPGASQTDYFLPAPLPAPSFTLTSQNGVPVSSGDFPDKLLVVFFGYTSCPDVCPLTLANLSRAFARMGDSAGQIQVLLISVDPARDTPERLEQYLAAFDPSFLGLTGSEAEVREVADGFGAYFSVPAAGEGENYTVDHTSRVFIVDPAGEIPLTFPVTATPEEIARDLAHLLEQQG